ncbi:MAG TPA: polyamine aminopropyltransferase [Spirochaetota bacterium]|nr:polyamine aminopropyltransferase [Spirochaetota bacterium]OPZ36217.1 MAG: Spermidine synthase [Spirochaetes bacterium ADurb.BinA120]HNU92342.1 polyamine aminopropyltransferase [Spirochaetota bacterium]HPO46864.1 polyamine aminopropyltransferase [Spirochaetota bacterium]HPV98589.1 polyamine aminopropyltransferase [Spirochaetota bacterium]
MSSGSELWFEEILEKENGHTFKIKIDNLIERVDSKFQRIEVYETVPFGRMLVIDGVIMCTEWDEYAYHEMIAHVPMFTHRNPENVLVIGGGDGGTIREVLRHPEARRVDICEIDGEVVRLSKKHLPTMSSSFDDPRVRLYTEDGAKYMKEHPSTYDVIIVDSSDPIGPAVVLFSEGFYVDMKNALRDDGIIATQCESFFYHSDIVERITGYAKKHFAVPGYYYTVVPTYPSGIIGFCFASKKYHYKKDFRPERVSPMQGQLKYYTPEVHGAAFTLPAFIGNRIKL